MNIQSLIASLLAGKVGTKLFGRLGKRFGLTPQQTTTILMVGIPIIWKFMQSRKKANRAAPNNIIKGKVRK